jgi:vitamin B12 transporter
MTKLTPTRGVEYFAGYDFQNYSGQDDVLLIAPNTERVHALFGQVRTTPELSPRLTLAAGARYNAPSHAQSAAVWNVSGRYEVTPSLFARAGAGTAFRYPDAYELFAIDPTCCFGSPDLKPERSTNVNGSIGHSFRVRDTAVALEAIGFYRNVTDLIADVDDGSGETTVTANLPDRVKVRGLTLVGSAAFTRAVSGQLGYTYTRSQRTNDLAGGYSALAGIPSHQVEASVDVHPGEQPFGFTVTLNHVGEMFDTVSGFGQVPSGRYAVVDLSGRIFVGKSRRQRVSLRLENLFDEQYTTIHARGFTDDGGSAFLVHNLGAPRTLYVSYSVSY